MGSAISAPRRHVHVKEEELLEEPASPTSVAWDFAEKEDAGKREETRGPSLTTSSSGKAPETSCCSSSFLDSQLVANFLSAEEADEIFTKLRDCRRVVQSKGRYPLRTDYYGVPRGDGCLALDKWGSNYESWARVQKPPEALSVVRQLVCDRLGGGDDDCFANSIAVNYYDGPSVPIPAHQDSVASLVDGSNVICLTLGASRDFLFTGLSDAGASREAEMTDVKRRFRPAHGDLFLMGTETNAQCCHAIPCSDDDRSELRISVIFRCVDRSFVNIASPPKTAAYASGKERQFTTASVVVLDNDEETTTHLADLVTQRETLKMEKKNMLPNDENTRFFLGQGEMAKLIDDAAAT